MIVFFTQFFNSLSYTENEFLIYIISRFLYHECKRTTEFEYLYIFANTYSGLFPIFVVNTENVLILLEFEESHLIYKTYFWWCSYDNDERNS